MSAVRVGAAAPHNARGTPAVGPAAHAHVTRGARVVASALVLLLAGGCPPPADDVRAGDPDYELPLEGTASPSPAAPSAPPAGTLPDVPVGTSETAPVVYEKLRGGVAVARCPACGAVQPRGAERCGSCQQAISAWRHEESCSRCATDGRCDHCGDDRTCLACDGDGRCATCAGTGSEGGARCPECAGTKQCVSCLGDGRREHAARDFSVAEGWMPGACATCIDASGLCPECGSAGKDRTGGACATCGGAGACPDCAGDGGCTWCGADGRCPQCEGGGVFVRNGALRGPEAHVRRLRTAAGSPLTGRVLAPPSAKGLQVVTEDKGRSMQTVLPQAQVDPLTWLLAVRDFPPGWDDRAVPEYGARTRHLFDVASLASDHGLWGPGFRALSLVIATDPGQAQDARVRITELENRRADAWTRRADEAARAGDRDRALVLLEMAGFRARGTAVATRAGLQALTLRKERETEASKLADVERVRRHVESSAAVGRVLATVRARLGRAAALTQRATQAAASDPSIDRTFARAEYAAWFARRSVETAASRWPAGDVDWATAPADLVTESRRVSASVLEAWATHALGGGRFALGLRLARRGAALDPRSDALGALVVQAENGVAREGILNGTPAPGSR